MKPDVMGQSKCNKIRQGTANKFPNWDNTQMQSKTTSNKFWIK